MNNKYDFSVIIPTHNSTNTINSCLDSIIQQNYNFQKVEVIIIDDGSDDNLKDWLQGYTTKYSNILYFYKNYGKLGSTINYVIENKLANGRYITILDPKDKLNFNCFSTIFNYFSDNIDLFLSDFYVWKIKQKKSGKLYNGFKYQKIIFARSSKIFVKRRNIEKTRTPWSITLCKFYKNELFYLLDRSIEDTYFQDAILFNDALEKVHVVKYINKPLGWWRNDFQLKPENVKWSLEESSAWLNTIYDLANGNGKLIALFYIFYYKDFKKYLLDKNIKIKIPGKINTKWIPFGLRTIIKLFILIANKKYIIR